MQYIKNIDNKCEISLKMCGHYSTIIFNLFIYIYFYIEKRKKEGGEFLQYIRNIYNVFQQIIYIYIKIEIYIYFYIERREKEGENSCSI